MSKTYTLTQDEYDQVKHLIEKDSKQYSALEDFIGGGVFIRTVTMYYTGKVEKIAGKFLVLSQAAWIADTGRFNDFIQGKPTSALEVEPMGDTMINIDTITDISSYSNMFTSQK